MNADCKWGVTAVESLLAPRGVLFGDKSLQCTGGRIFSDGRQPDQCVGTTFWAGRREAECRGSRSKLLSRQMGKKGPHICPASIGKGLRYGWVASTKHAWITKAPSKYRTSLQRCLQHMLIANVRGHIESCPFSSTNS